MTGAQLADATALPRAEVERALATRCTLRSCDRQGTEIDAGGGVYWTVGFEAVESGFSASMGARVAFVNRATAQ